MATQVLNDALGTSPSLIRGLGERSGLKERATFARTKMPETFEGIARAEEDAARTQFGIQQGQIKKEAEAEGALAAQSRQATTKMEAGIKPYEEFAAPEIKASDYAKSAGMRLLSALVIGGIGGASGKSQLMAIREMQDAEDRGQRERFASAKLKFDEADRARKDHNQMLKDRFERMLNLLSKDRNAAMVEAKLIEGQTGNGLISAQLRKGNYQKAYDLFNKAIESSDKADIELEKQRTIFEEKKALKMTPSGGKMGGGGDGSGKRKIEQIPAALEKKMDNAAEAGIALNRANSTRKPQYFGIAPNAEVANLIISGVEKGLPTGDIMASLGSKAPKVTRETVAWWKDYDAFLAVVRNKLFGATLTNNEQASFLKFTITPATSPEVADMYFKNQQKIVNDGIARERRKASARGVSDETISAYLDLPEDEAPQDQTPAPAAQPKKISTKAEYDALPPNAEYIDTQTGKRGRKPAAR
jgi:tetratricopeptide (TPR) repeat protein